MIKTFQYRLYPTTSQRKTMESTIETCRRFYNDCLAERKEAYEERKESIGKFAHIRKVKVLKGTNSYAKNIHSHVLEVTAADLDKAFQAFFRRRKAGEKAGYPRFKGQNRFDSFGYKEYGNGFKVDGRRLKLSGVGRVAIRWHRPLEGEIKTLRITRKAGKFSVILTKTHNSFILKNGKSQISRISSLGIDHNPCILPVNNFP